QQMRYYKGLGESMTDEQLAINAQMVLQQKGGNLSDRQMKFAQDIIYCYQFMMQMNEWEKQYTKSAPNLITPLK
ncbi:MAG TPA: hypothetical protein VE035_03840, partial [Puia sp.]|nr:hypothetical protein [Puia sp.]